MNQLEAKQLQVFPVYWQSYRHAASCGQVDQWEQSRQQNICCKKSLEALCANQGNPAEKNTLIADAVARFGVERMVYVLAKTVQMRGGSTHFPEMYRAWAGSFQFAAEDDLAHQGLLCIVRSEPQEVAALISEMRLEHEFRKAG